jgi:phosphoglucosamine mutase
MRQHGCNLGGEQSGHILLSDYANTGDGLLASLQVLGVMQQQKQRLSACAGCYTPFPQRLTNIRLNDAKQDPTKTPAVQEAITNAEAELNGNGRLFIRKSGTEPLLRVMIEAKEDAMVNRLSDTLKHTIEAAA